MSEPISRTARLEAIGAEHQLSHDLPPHPESRDSAGQRPHHLFEQETNFLGRQYFQQEGNPRISIWDLMLLTGSIAVGVNVILQIGMVGSLVLFAGCSLVSTIVRANPASRRFWIQYCWVIFMPLACVFGDPMVFGSFEFGKPQRFNALAIPSYVFIAWQIFFLITSWFITPERQRFNGFLGGTFLAGALFALLIGICLIPGTMIGILMLIGMLGVVPWLTALTLYRTAHLHLRRSRNSRGRWPIFFATAGFVLPIAIWTLLLALSLIGLIDPNQMLSPD